MGVSWETLAVGLIVGAAAVWAVRGAWQATRRKQVCSTCGSAGDCPLAQAKGEPGAPCGVTPVQGLDLPADSRSERTIP